MKLPFPSETDLKYFGTISDELTDYYPTEHCFVIGVAQTPGGDVGASARINFAANVDYMLAGIWYSKQAMQINFCILVPKGVHIQFRCSNGGSFIGVAAKKILWAQPTLYTDNLLVIK